MYTFASNIFLINSNSRIGFKHRPDIKDCPCDQKTVKVAIFVHETQPASYSLIQFLLVILNICFQNQANVIFISIFGNNLVSLKTQSQKQYVQSFISCLWFQM